MLDGAIDIVDEVIGILVETTLPIVLCDVWNNGLPRVTSTGDQRLRVVVGGRDNQRALDWHRCDCRLIVLKVLVRPVLRAIKLRLLIC